jgi:hypothetical protein
MLFQNSTCLGGRLFESSSNPPRVHLAALLLFREYGVPGAIWKQISKQMELIKSPVIFIVLQ